MLTVIYRRVIFRYNGSSGGDGGGGNRGKGVEAEDRGRNGRQRENQGREGGFGLRGYQCVSSLQNECPRFLPRGLYHVATIHAPPAAWLLAEGCGDREGGLRGRRRLSLILWSVNNKNIDITRPYIKAAAFGSLCV